MKKQKEPKPDVPVRSGSLTVPEAPKALMATPQVSEAETAFMQEAGPQVPAKLPQIPLVQIAHQEAMFKLPGGEMAEVVSGYPLYYFQTRRYYVKPPEAGQKGKPPDCWSGDLVRPDASVVNKVSEMCVGCRMAEWGSGRDGKSQGCAVQTWIIVVNPDFGNPPMRVLVAPPSSIRALLGSVRGTDRGYFGNCEARYGRYQLVWTNFRLHQWGGGVTYCTLEPEMGEFCSDPQMAKQLGILWREWRSVMEKLRGLTATATGGGEE